MKETIIDFIRHGQPEGGSVYRGHGVDDPLSDLGWQQMWQAVGNASPWQQIISSPMLRCKAFAEQLSDKYQLPLSIDERFKEVGFGSWEGRNRKEIQENSKSEYDAFYNDPINCRPDGAEPIDAFISRVVVALDEVINQYRGQHCLVVAHAGVIRAVVSHVTLSAPLGLYKIQVDNAGISRVCHGQYGNKLIFHNAALPEAK
ncbi:MAG: histidine phosphatase family protein [Gammaproteobacteria bacterium]|nr:histidine phosphatase family protein [Gammaproteobacteria bacterium]